MAQITEVAGVLDYIENYCLYMMNIKTRAQCYFHRERKIFPLSQWKQNVNLQIRFIMNLTNIFRFVDLLPSKPT